MRLFLKLLLGLTLLTAVSLFMRTDETYSPSISALKPNETLVMKYSACHSGCDKGTVEFKNKTASMKGHTLDLTQIEVRDLDLHFLSADELSDDYFCSMQIMISFKKTSAFKLSVRKKSRRYPCVFSDLRDSISPEMLTLHFNETPDEIPFWRRPAEDRIFIIEN